MSGQGMVYLVGAGPGDPGLITAKGLEAIRKADCIVYDRLAAPELLMEAKQGCEKIYVGKADHRHTMPQEEISLLLVKKSREYEHVVRLKGGDVYVFGRGGEEGICLREHGVPFVVIPGITSAVAGPACAGIPVTHRGIAQGFHVVTAHSQKDELAEIDFEAMARGNETCVFLMGLSKVKEIADRLMEAGMAPGMRAAVISCATTPAQRVCVSKLSQIAAEVERAALVSPAIIVVGEVVSLRETLETFVEEAKPLSGKRYLIPKIGREPTRLGGLLRAEGAWVWEVVVGEIVPAERRIAAGELAGVDWLVFTSRNGVAGFFAGLAGSGTDVRCLAGRRIAAIGKKTAEELGRHGLYADLMPEEPNTGALVKALREQLRRSDRVWYVKAANADSRLRDALADCCRPEELVVYENRAVELPADNPCFSAAYDGILFTCASSAGRFLDAAKGRINTLPQVYSIGPKTTAYLRERGIAPVREAAQSDYEGLAAAVREAEGEQ